VTTESTSLPTLHLQFPNIPLTQGQIPQWRGAVIASIGGEHAAEGTDRFHNHQPGSGQYLYRWSSVQYRVVDGCAGLWAIGPDSTSDLLHWVAKLPATLRVGQRMYPLGPLRIRREVHTLRIDTQAHRYQLRQYLPLNQQNHREHTEKDSMTERIKDLERLIGSHIIAFAKAVDWRVPERFDIEIHDIQRMQSTPYKETPLMAYDLTFSTTVVLPPHIGLGRKTAFGYGVCTPL
jgi:Cas6b C-terminal domain/Cas6b N-terminal domain